MSSYPRYSSSYRVTRETSGPGGASYYSSMYSTPTVYSPSRTYHSSYMVPSTRTYTYSVPSRTSYTSYRPSYTSYTPRWFPSNPYLPAELWTERLATCSHAPALHRTVPVYSRPRRPPPPPPPPLLLFPPSVSPACPVGDHVTSSAALSRDTRRKLREIYTDFERDTQIQPPALNYAELFADGNCDFTAASKRMYSNTNDKTATAKVRNPALGEWRPRHASGATSGAASARCDMSSVRLNVAIMSYFDRVKEMSDHAVKHTVSLLSSCKPTAATEASADCPDVSNSTKGDEFFSAQTNVMDQEAPSQDVQHVDTQYSETCNNNGSTSPHNSEAVQSEKTATHDVTLDTGADSDVTAVKDDVIDVCDEVSQSSSLTQTTLSQSDISVREQAVLDAEPQTQDVEADTAESYGQDHQIENGETALDHLGPDSAEQCDAIEESRVIQSEDDSHNEMEERDSTDRPETVDETMDDPHLLTSD